MSSNSTMPGPALPLLQIQRRFDAAPELVYRAFLEPELARHWLFTSPDTDIAARKVDLDARVGGQWWVTNPMPSLTVEGGGEYLELDPPRRIVFTFCIPQFSPDSDLITVDIVPDGSGCLLTLCHKRLPLAYHSATENGWGKMFVRLEALLEGRR